MMVEVSKVAMWVAKHGPADVAVTQARVEGHRGDTVGFGRPLVVVEVVRPGHVRLAVNRWSHVGMGVGQVTVVGDGHGSC